jgi:hypothetical protein
MTRLTHACLTALLAAFMATACAPSEPTEPNAVAAKASKPGGGGGGSAGLVGQLLGSAYGSKAYAVNASYAVGREGAAATAWSAAGAAIPLPVDASASGSVASGINASSTIVGDAGPSAVVWQPTGAGAWASAVPLPAPPGSWSGTRALAINDQGQIAGTGTRSDNLKFALRWSPVVEGYAVEVVPAAGADYEFVGNAIANGNGWVTGWVRRTVNGTIVKDAFVWTAGAFRLLGRLNGASSEGRGINTAGRVVGWSASAPKGGDSTPITWTCTESGCTAPTALPAFYRNANFAFGIDDAGDIVGTSGLSGILYGRCGPTTVLNPPAGWHQSYGWAISGDGTAAVGYSFLDSRSVQATRWQLPAATC